MVTSKLELKRQRGIALVIPILALLVLAFMPAASAYTATLVSPADITDTHNGDRVSIRVNDLVENDIFQLNISSADLNTTGGTFSIDNFALPFGIVNGTASTSLVGSNLNASGLRLVVARADGDTITQQNQTSSNPYRIYLTNDILKTSYNISITGFPQNTNGVTIDFSVHGNITNPNNPAFLNFTIRHIRSGDLRIRVNNGSTDQLDTTLTITQNAATNAIFRPSSGYWYFDKNLDGTINKSFRFGKGGDQAIARNWAGTGDGIAIFRPASGYWYFDYNLDGAINNSYRFGKTGDQPVAGNWAGTRDGIAIFRNSSGYWYFDYNLDGAINNSYRFGKTGDQAIAGNWAGTGDGIAIFRPATGYWYFDYNLNGAIDNSYRFGKIGDQPVAGDWQGTGKDGIAIFRPSSGYWYFDYNLDGVIDKSFRYGTTGDQAIAGDWQGTGSNGIAIFRPSSGYWYFDYNLDGVVDKSFRYGKNGDQIAVGRWV